MPAMAPRAATGLPQAPQLSVSEQAEEPGRITAALASILSGTATDAQCQAFQEAAMRSSAARLDARSALAFVDGIEQAPATAPAHLVQQLLAPAGRAASGLIGASQEMQLAAAAAAPSGAAETRKAGIWSRVSQRWLVAPRGRMAAACAMLLMAGGLTWSLWRPAQSPEDGSIVPVETSPKDAPLLRPEPVKPAPAPLALPTAATAPAVISAPMPPPAQALADPCAPRGLANSEALAAATTPEFKAPRRPPDRQLKSAVASAPDPGCGADPSRLATSPATDPTAADAGKAAAFEAGRHPQSDQGPVRTARPSSQFGGIDRDSPAILSAPGSAPAAARPASPAMHPSAIAPAR
jgi:hypothetical protein